MQKFSNKSGEVIIVEQERKYNSTFYLTIICGFFTNTFQFEFIEVISSVLFNQVNHSSKTLLRDIFL